MRAYYLPSEPSNLVASDLRSSEKIPFTFRLSTNGKPNIQYHYRMRIVGSERWSFRKNIWTNSFSVNRYEVVIGNTYEI